MTGREPSVFDFSGIGRDGRGAAPAAGVWPWAPSFTGQSTAVAAPAPALPAAVAPIVDAGEPDFAPSLPMPAASDAMPAPLADAGIPVSEPRMDLPIPRSAEARTVRRGASHPFSGDGATRDEPFRVPNPAAIDRQAIHAPVRVVERTRSIERTVEHQIERNVIRVARAEEPATPRAPEHRADQMGTPETTPVEQPAVFPPPIATVAAARERELSAPGTDERATRKEAVEPRDIHVPAGPAPVTRVAVATAPVHEQPRTAPGLRVMGVPPSMVAARPMSTRPDPLPAAAPLRDAPRKPGIRIGTVRLVVQAPAPKPSAASPAAAAPASMPAAQPPMAAASGFDPWMASLVGWD